MKSIKLTTALLAVLLFSSCSVVKQNGYYQSRKYKTQVVKTKKHRKSKKDVELAKVKPRNATFSDLKTTRYSKELQAYDATTKQTLTATSINGKFTNNTKTIQTDSCDLITLKDGTEISAKVTEVGVSEVRYKRCDNQTGPTYVMNKSDIFMIKYSNGTKDVIQEVQPKTVKKSINQTPDKTRNSGKGVGWLVFIIGLVMLLFISILVGAIVMLVGIIILATG
ncbi:MAG: hypothetical protein ACI9JN_000388 [Bacteroidia bacterium]|jgi:hypothetical protein